MRLGATVGAVWMVSLFLVLTAHCAVYILIEGKFIDVYNYHKMIIVGNTTVPYYTLFLSHFLSVIIVAMLDVC